MSTDQPTATATPRTDTQPLVKIYDRAGMPYDSELVSPDFARTLERELSSAQAALAEAKTEVERLNGACALAGIGDYVADYYLGKLTTTGQLRAEVAEFQAELRNAQTKLCDALTEAEGYKAEVARLKEELREAQEDADEQEARESELYWRKQYEESCIALGQRYDEWQAELTALRARVAELDTDNCRLINKVDVQAVELHRLEATIVTLSGQCTSLFNERETLLVDRGCMDWLETQTVEVRSPLNHGSRELFCVSPIRGDGEERPSRLRAAIDAAKGQP